MKRYLAGLAAAAVLATAVSAWAATIPAHFFGNEYRGLPGELRAAYAVGLYDGLVEADYLYHHNDSTWLEACVELDEVTPNQLVWAFDEYLDEHPQILHYPAPTSPTRSAVVTCA